jgi:cytochrome c oxidase assembly protein subunit 15
MQTRNRYIKWWLWTGAGLIFVMLIIGGITRLTGSGLSMTDWNLIMGAIPPMNEPEWMAVFERYQQFPQYQKLNMGMTLTEFKAIFFWEYVHRLLGRVIGIVFLIPFLFFWIGGYFSRRMFRRALVLFGLGALQGAIGWFMVKSGLIDMPHVSHYRLAFHLLLAFLLVSCCAWFALDIDNQRPKSRNIADLKIKSWSIAVAMLFFVQATWGAFTAGLDAGYIYNTFPMMNGAWLPLEAWAMKPRILNLVENPATVQWMHRLMGTLLGLATIWLWIRTRKANVRSSVKMKSTILLGLILVQYSLGVLTLLYHVPVALGVSHQAVAMLFWIDWLVFYHNLGSYRKEIPHFKTYSKSPIKT